MVSRFVLPAEVVDIVAEGAGSLVTIRAEAPPTASLLDSAARAFGGYEGDIGRYNARGYRL